MRKLSVIMLFVYVMILAMPSFAESSFIMWSIADDAKFRVKYEQLTGETVAPSTQLNEAGTHYLLGTSRATDQEISDLLSDRTISAKEGDIKTRKGIYPVDWVPKVVE